ncbi:MAG: amidase [Hyphomicrobiales bacterium]
MTPEEYARLDGTALAQLIARDEVSRADVLRAAYARIGEENPRLNAVIDLYDPPVVDPSAHGSFAGVPFLLKDVGAGLAGKRTRLGSALFRDGPPQSHDDELSLRFLKAGFAILGKTNIPEFGFNVTSEPVAFGATRNPLDVTRTPGGSSGGAAAAVASGMVPVAHATDGAGSIRIPAAACGLVGLKPSRGLVPQGPKYTDVFGGLVVEGVVSRTVRDTAAVLDAIAGPDAGASYAAPVLKPPKDRLRIGIITQGAADTPVSAAALAAVEEAAGVFRALGHEVAPLDLPFLPEDWAVPRQVYLAQNCAQLAADFEGKPVPDAFEPINRAALLLGRGMSAAAFLRIVRRGQRFARRFATAVWPNVDVLLTPALAEPPPRLGSFPTDHDDVALHVDRMTRIFPFAGLFNLTGGAALALPARRTAEGLPVGIQIAGDIGDDRVLLALGARYEAATA